MSKSAPSGKQGKPIASRALEFLAVFLILYVVSQYFFGGGLFGNREKEAPIVTVRMQDATVRQGNEVIALIHNATAQPLRLTGRCPMPPFEIFRVTGTGTLTPLTGESALPCTPVTEIAADATHTVHLDPWKYSLFSQNGEFELRLPVDATVLPAAGSGAQHQLTTRFAIHEPNFIIKLFRGLITKPFLNFLVFVASWLPDHSLGLAIIILTIVVKLILFFPTQHALEGQRKMQLLQPKLDELRAKFKDPQKLHEETMKVWKEHGVNPLQSCLPMLIQLPILIGLFYVIRHGSVLETAREFLYPTYQNLPWTFNHSFLGLDLTKPNLYVMPPLLAVLQFIQMKLTFHLNKKKDAPKKAKSDPQVMQQQIMLYAMPLMIGYFAFQFPAAVSLYWGVSTLFAIGQQLIVNRERLKV